MFCENCGCQIPEGVKFCTACGSKVNTDGYTPAQQTVQPQPVNVSVTNSNVAETEIIRCKGACAKGSMSWKNGQCSLTNKRFVFYKRKWDGAVGGAIGGGMGAMALIMLAKGAVIPGLIIAVAAVIIVACILLAEPEYDFEIPLTEITNIKRGTHGAFAALVICTKNYDEHAFYLGGNLNLVEQYINQLLQKQM